VIRTAAIADPGPRMRARHEPIAGDRSPISV